MKKAKIFLTALTVLTVAAGVVAFKAKAPKEFGTCDINTKKCTLNPFFSPRDTAPSGPQLTTFDLTSNNCKEIQPGVFTCETYTIGE